MVRDHNPFALLFEKGIDQGLKRRSTFLLEFGIDCAAQNRRAEHHTVMRRIFDGETDIRLAHRVEAWPSFTCVLPRRDERHPKHSKALARDGTEQRRLVREVAIKRSARHANVLPDTAQCNGLNALALNSVEGGLHERPAEVT